MNAVCGKKCRIRAVLSGLVLVLGGLACATSAPTPTPTAEATPTTRPTETSQPTDTATPVPSDTAVPSATATETPPPSETPTATPDLAATAAVESTQAAQAILEQVEPVLTGIDVSLTDGYLDWTEPEPIPVISDEFLTLVYNPINKGVAYTDFVLNVDITWESTSGLAGCGIIFRSESNLEYGEQYRFFALRLSGLPLWDVELWKYGDWQSTTTGEMKVNSAIDQDNGATNNYVLVVRDTLLTAYANGMRLSNVIVSSRADGEFAYFAWQESGRTSCIYENSWIWVIEQE